MKKSLFMTTAAIAMLAGVHFVNAQAGGGGSGGSGGGGSTSNMGGSSGGSGTMGGSGATQTQRGSGSEMQRGGNDHTSGQRPGATASEKQTPGSTQHSQGENKSGSSTRSSQSSSQSNTGSAPSATQVTAEQKTKIKSHMGELRAGRVDNVNFSISVGTVVPHSVTLHTLPVAIVEIVPAYRGYRYILVRDEIVIIDPNTLRIVAVIEA